VKLLVYGSGDLGRVARDLLVRCGHEFAGFVNDFEREKGVLGSFDEVRERHAPGDFGMLLAVGYSDLAARWRLYERVKAAGYYLPALVHPAAYVHSAQTISEGTLVMARAVVDMDARVAEACVLWPGANVSHDSSIGRNCFLSPNCTVCGFVTLGDGCFLGAGSVVVDHRQVPAGTRVKAGTVFA
jgi:sugar O-acyltransferase (sialic acid O-acetyltransferase NeuD family)